MEELKESRVAIMDRLAVDESTVFEVPRSSSISKAVAILQRRTGKRFTRKKVDGGVRVTRIVSPSEAAGFAPEPAALPVPSGDSVTAGTNAAVHSALRRAVGRHTDADLAELDAEVAAAVQQSSRG